MLKKVFSQRRRRSPSVKHNVFLSRSPSGVKKFYVKIEGEKKQVNFGQKGYQDFTMHKDEQRKKNYINRHMANEDWNNWNTAGFWSRWLLWNKPTIQDSIKDIERKFLLNIIRKDGKNQKKKKSLKK